MKCKCGKEMEKLRDRGILYFESDFRCSCGIELNVMLDLEGKEKDLLYVVKK